MLIRGIICGAFPAKTPQTPATAGRRWAQRAIGSEAN
jgi:hypothetical protein